MSFPTERFSKLEVTSAEELGAWLQANHHQTESVWLVRYLKHVPAKSVPIEAILDELLCFGWIDGLARKLDDERTLRLISPRRHQRWTRSYKERADRLIEKGRMQPAGLRAIEQSKARGEWSDQEDVDDLLIPDDLANTLRQTPGAWKYFSTAAPSYRRNVLRWIKLAKRADTRTKRIVQTAELSRKAEKVPQM